jgi:circadian clock protein KaiC
MGMRFMVRGALGYGEPGVFVAFEESPAELAQNVASLGWDLADLTGRKLLAVDHVQISASEILETGSTRAPGLLSR